MEGRKENKYNLSGICPECGKLIKVELVIATELVETGETKKAEAKPDEGKGEAKGTGSDTPESDSVRPADEAGPAGTTGTGDKPADPKKGPGTKKAGGKAK